MATQKSSSKAGKKAPSKIASIKEALFGGKKKNDKGHDAKKVAHGAKVSHAPAKPAKTGAAVGSKPAAHPQKHTPQLTQKKGAAPTKHVPAPKAAASGKAHVASPAAKDHGAAVAKTSGNGKAVASAPVKAASQKAPGAGSKKKGEIGYKNSLRGASLLDAESVCREVACEGLSTTAGYCRLHYIKNWKKIKRKELILKEGKLNQYIEELVAKYPDKYIEAIRQDLASDKDFAKVIYDLDLDEGADDFDVDGESLDSVIDTIKRDFDDEGEGGF